MYTEDPGVTSLAGSALLSEGISYLVLLPFFLGGGRYFFFKYIPIFLNFLSLFLFLNLHNGRTGFKKEMVKPGGAGTHL